MPYDVLLIYECIYIVKVYPLYIWCGVYVQWCIVGVTHPIHNIYGYVNVCVMWLIDWVWCTY